MLIEFGITGDAVNDCDTAVHEYKHFMVELVGLGPEGHNWVEDSPDGDAH